MFVTTPEFLPQHREHCQQVLQIITAAEARGQRRTPLTPVPARQRSSDASLLRRVEAADQLTPKPCLFGPSPLPEGIRKERICCYGR
jgi:hypothetical protein